MLLRQPVFLALMDDWRLVPRPERFTQLYFADHRQLPIQAESQTNRHTMSFVVRNLEHRSTSYRYRLVAVSEDNHIQHLLGNGVFTVGHNGSQIINTEIVVPSIGPRIMITVQLKYEGIAHGQDIATTQRQSIHYWVGMDGYKNLVAPS